ncbi:unnamed protein product [Rhodiola kirilowii]
MSSFGQSLLAQWILLPLMLLPVLYLLLLKHAKRGLNLPTNPAQTTTSRPPSPSCL